MTWRTQLVQQFARSNQNIILKSCQSKAVHGVLLVVNQFWLPKRRCQTAEVILNWPSSINTMMEERNLMFSQLTLEKATQDILTLHTLSSLMPCWHSHHGNYNLTHKQTRMRDNGRMSNWWSFTKIYSRVVPEEPDANKIYQQICHSWNNEVMPTG